MGLLSLLRTLRDLGRDGHVRYKKDEVVEVVKNPRESVKSTLKYIGEPAEIIAVINNSTFLLRFSDYRQLTVNIDCIKKL